MKIYHGSLEVVEHPMILQPNRKLDYGEGFYTTTSEKQAKEWAEFVMANRTQKGFTHNYDIVYGPVANDRVYLQFGLYESGANSPMLMIAAKRHESHGIFSKRKY